MVTFRRSWADSPVGAVGVPAAVIGDDGRNGGQASTRRPLNEPVPVVSTAPEASKTQYW